MKKKTMTVKQYMFVLTMIIPKLGLQNISDGDLVTYADEKKQKIDLEPALAAVSPSTATVKTKRDLYNAALAKAEDGTTADTSDKNDQRADLAVLLTLQALDCARIANGDITLYLKSGYEAKDLQGSPVGELGATTEIVFRNYGKTQGELQPDWTPVENARNYTVQVYTDPANPDGSVVKEVMVNPSIAKIGGLARGREMWVRVRANGGAGGFGPWSDPANKMVP